MLPARMTPVELADLLLAMPPRSAQVLGNRFLEGRSREDCAALYGLTLESWDALLFRSAREFGVPHPASISYEDEVREAAALRSQLESDPSHPLNALTQHRDEVRRLLVEAELKAEASPARARETLLRRLAIVAILVLSAYFYWRQQEKEHAQRRADWMVQPAPKN